MRTKKTIINLIVNVLSVPITALLGLWMTQLVLLNYGSDINGLNALITQIIAVILVLEAGLGAAVNSKLYKPYVDNNTFAINAILSVTKKGFELIAVVFSLLSFIVLLVVPNLINTDIPKSTIVVLFILACIPTAIYLGFSLKYKPLYDVSQSEYILSGINLVITILGQVVAIIFIYRGASIELVRFWIMFFLTLRSILIYVISKKRYKEFQFQSKEKDYSFLKEMPSVISLKITSLIYGTAPILYISFAIGTMMTSVYSVYNMIFMMLKSLAYALVNAPANAFGQLLANKENLDAVKEKFLKYQLIVILFVTILLVTCMIVILPFIELYTNRVDDINYIDFKMAVLICIITFLEIIHIPSGLMMQVTGAFKENRKMQNIATLSLIFSIIIFPIFTGFYGVLLALVICNIILCFMEVKYAFEVIFKTTMWKFYSMVFVNASVGIFLVTIFKDVLEIKTLIEFMYISLIVFIASSLIIYTISYVFFKDNMLKLNTLVTRIKNRRL